MARSDHGSAEDRQLTGQGHALQFKILREGGVAADVSKDSQRSGSNDGASDGETVQAVGKIHRVARTHNHQHHKGHKRKKRQRPERRIVDQLLNHQVGMKLFDEGHHQLGRIGVARLHGNQRHRDQDAHGNLQAQLGFRGEPQIPSVHHFDVVVGKSNGGEGAGGKHRDPYEQVAQVGPQQSRDHDGNGDQQAAHGRSAGFFLMGLGPLFPDELADLKFAQPVDDDGADNQCREQCGEAGKSCTKGQITENTEWREVVEQLQVQQPVEQSASLQSSVVGLQSSRNSGQERSSAVVDLLRTED